MEDGEEGNMKEGRMEGRKEGRKEVTWFLKTGATFNEP